MKKIVPENNRPPQNLPYQNVNNPFKLEFIIPGKGINIQQDANGVLYISSDSGVDAADLVAGDNIELTKTDDGKVVISAVNSINNITAGENVTVNVDPETGDVIISSEVDGSSNEHYQGVFDTTQDLIAYDTEPEQGDYGMVKTLVYSDGGEASWNGQFKYCFYINGTWSVVDQMLTFTDDLELLQQYYSVGGGSQTIYLHKVAQTGDFNDLKNVPIVATPVVTVEGQTVTAECATDGAEIWYTTDGSMPHVNGTKYTGPITVDSPTSFRFVGIKNGMINSLEEVASADYSLQAPTVSLDWHDGTVTMQNPNSGGTIYYTTDGSTPTASSNQYTDPFVITAQTTFNMIVIDGGSQSDMSSKTFRKVVTPRKGTTSNNWILNRRNQQYFTSTANDAEVEYRVTIDGTTPTWDSPAGAGTISRPIFTNDGLPATVKVTAYSYDMVPSDVFTMEVGEGTPDAPSIVYDSETGTVTIERTGNTVKVNLLTESSRDNDDTGCHIFYTLDGSTPTTNSTRYRGPFTVNETCVVKAILVAYLQFESDVATENIGVLEAPVFSYDWQTGTLKIENPNSSGTIYYTTDGSDPSSDNQMGAEYSEPIVFPDMQMAEITFKAIVESGLSKSAINGHTYAQVSPASMSIVNFNPNTGYGDLVLSTTSPLPCLIRVEDGPVTSESEALEMHPQDGGGSYGTVQFQRFQEGGYPMYRTYIRNHIPSVTASTGPRVQELPDAPTIIVDEDYMVTMLNDGPLTWDIQLQTNNNVPNYGCRIYYTTDGSIPTSASTLYTGPFQAQQGDTIKAVLVAYGEYSSDVATYTDMTPEERYAYGVRHDKTSSSSDLTRIGNTNLHATLPVQSMMRRCLLLDNGTVNYYLDPEDSSLKADGTTADLSGTDGQFMVEIPEHWRKYVSEENYEEFWLSEVELDGYEHVPAMYISADEACLDHDTSKLAAVVNSSSRYRGGSNDDTNDSDQYLTLLGRPASNISWEDFYAYANSRGSGWTNYLLYCNTTLYWLFMVEYATLNSQKAYNSTLTAEGYRQGGLGPDVTEFYDWFGWNNGEPFIPTGISTGLGNHTGVTPYTIQLDGDSGGESGGGGDVMLMSASQGNNNPSSITVQVSTYRGITCPFGHLAKAASGAFVTSTDGETTYLYVCNDPNKIAFDPTADGYQNVALSETIDYSLVTGMGYVNGNLYPKTGGEYIAYPPPPLTEYFCDGAYIAGSDQAEGIAGFVSVPGLGGSAIGGSFCGFAFAFFVGVPSVADPNIGSRLCFIHTDSSWNPPTPGGNSGGWIA